jgi:cytochrome c peroxidase
VLFNTGVADGARRSPDLPLITLINRTTGATVQSTDPGLALTSGRWADIGKFKVPTLRLLAARAPYFHNGSAPTLGAVVAFYNQRFDLKLSVQEQTDLVAFLSAL